MGLELYLSRDVLCLLMFSGRMLECEGLAQAQMSLLLSGCTLHWSMRRPELSSWLSPLLWAWQLIFLFGSQFLIYKIRNVDHMSSKIPSFYLFLILNYEELKKNFSTFEVKTTPKPHGIWAPLHFCVNVDKPSLLCLMYWDDWVFISVVSVIIFLLSFYQRSNWHDG